MHGLENRLQHHRAVVVRAADPWRRIGWTDAPAPVLGRAEQSSKAGVAIEPRPAQPIDGAVATNESRGDAIADQRIILDAQRKIGAYGRLLPAARPGADACVRLLQLRLDLRARRLLSGIALDLRRSTLALRAIELLHDLRNDVLHQPSYVDADRILVGIRLLQDRELAVENRARCKRLLACGQARGNHRPVPVQIDDTHLRSPAGEEVAIAALEPRAGDDAALA